MNDLTTAPKGQITPASTREALSEFGFQIGEFSYGVPTVWWWGEPSILRIGNFCSFADGISILLGGNHRVDWVTTYPFSAISHWPEAAHLEGHPATNGDVIIGNDVWVGYKATILSGVTGRGRGSCARDSRRACLCHSGREPGPNDPHALHRRRYPAVVEGALVGLGFGSHPPPYPALDATGHHQVLAGL